MCVGINLYANTWVFSWGKFSEVEFPDHKIRIFLRLLGNCYYILLLVVNSNFLIPGSHVDPGCTIKQWIKWSWLPMDRCCWEPTSLGGTSCYDALCSLQMNSPSGFSLAFWFLFKSVLTSNQGEGMSALRQRRRWYCVFHPLAFLLLRLKRASMKGLAYLRASYSL